MHAYIIKRQLKDDAKLVKRGSGERTVDSKGKWVAGAITPEDVKVCRQPAEGTMRNPTQGGLRPVRVEVFYLADSVQAIEATTDEKRGDVIIHDGLAYQVETVENWTDYWRTECTLIDPQPDTLPA